MKLFLTCILILVVAAYPFVVFFSLESLGPAWLAGLLLVVLILRFTLFKTATLKTQNNRSQLMLIVAVVFLCLSVIVSGSETLLKFYPVLMSVGMASLFFISLYDKESLIERFARLAGNEIDETVKQYTRNVTKVWVLALLLNAVVAFYSACCASLIWWTYYNGLISYLLFGALFVIEYIYRYFYKKKHQKL